MLDLSGLTILTGWNVLIKIYGFSIHLLPFCPNAEFKILLSGYKGVEETFSRHIANGHWGCLPYFAFIISYSHDAIEECNFPGSIFSHQPVDFSGFVRNGKVVKHSYLSMPCSILCRYIYQFHICLYFFLTESVRPISKPNKESA